MGLVAVDTGNKVRVPPRQSAADLRAILLITTHDVHRAQQDRGVVRHVDGHTPVMMGPAG